MIRTGLELDGRWIAERPDVPGCLAYGETRAEAIRKCEELAAKIARDRAEHGEPQEAVPCRM